VVYARLYRDSPFCQVFFSNYVLTTIYRTNGIDMARSSNTFDSLKPIYKESYADKSRKKPKFKKLRDKILKNWKPKKLGES
jgi:hypothetical protein